MKSAAGRQDLFPRRGARARLALCVAVVSGLPFAAVAVSAAVCPALPAPGGTVVRVTTVAALVAAVAGATPGTTILLADGHYALGGAYLRITSPA